VLHFQLNLDSQEVDIRRDGRFTGTFFVNSRWWVKFRLAMNLHTVSGLIEDEDPGKFLGTAMWRKQLP